MKGGQMNKHGFTTEGVIMTKRHAIKVLMNTIEGITRSLEEDVEKLTEWEFMELVEIRQNAISELTKILESMQ